MSPTALNRGPDYDTGLHETPKTAAGWAFDIVRYLWSTVATVGSLFVIFYGISIQVRGCGALRTLACSSH